jgi:DNA-binding response OmpR family regulator
LRAEEDWTPVLFVTARDDEVDRILGLEIGADDYVTKPFSPRELVARVAAVLRRTVPYGESREVFRVGDLEIDLPKMTLRSGAETIDLTPTELRIVAALARHPGRVLTRAQLLEAARHEDAEPFDRAIDSHVKNIRRKLERGPSPKRVLESVYGIGYRLATP